MNRAQAAARELLDTDKLTQGISPLHRMHPGVKLICTLIFIGTVISFRPNELSGIAVMILFPPVCYRAAGINIALCFKKLRAVLPLVCAVGIFNPFIDREIVFYAGRLGVTSGMISMLTLMIKGVICLTASFLLAATTPLEDICAALRKFHVPAMLVTLLLLTCRYVSLLLEEAGTMMQSYQLRAPGQKGIHISAWGSFLGQLLLRSADRGSELYNSMVLRGYKGDFQFSSGVYRLTPSLLGGVLFTAAVILCRIFNVAELLGGLINV